MSASAVFPTPSDLERSMSSRPSPECILVQAARRYSRVVARSLRFDGDDLTVEVQGSGFAYARLVFRRPAGFRVLDERDLCEFWPVYSEPNGWLWEVLRGGWMDLERERPLFNSHEFHSNLREFLIVGDRCISVLSSTYPELEDLGADPQ